MRAWKHWGPGIVVLATLACWQTHLASGQDRPASGEDTETPELPNLHPFHRAIYLSARRGSEWLWQANRPDGLFIPGQVPSLNTVMEEDHYLRQAGAAYALARAARFTHNERHAVRARQALLALLTNTRTDPKDSAVRHTLFPSVQVNRVAAAGYLVLAISELPEAGQDLLEQSEQLCQYLRKQQLADGSIKVMDEPADPKTMPDVNEADREAPPAYAGLALAALMRSQAQQPAAWKTDVVRKALTYYRGEWQKAKNLRLVPPLSSAFTEAYLLTQEKPFADFVFEMNDWVCTLQIGVDPRVPLWQGGFVGWKDGKMVAQAPSVESALYAESLVDACRCARQVGDVARFPTYRDTTERALQFLMTLQYTPAKTRHFAEWYQPRVSGAYHATHQNGDARIDYTQLAVCAMTHYLHHIANVAPPGTAKR